MSALPSAGPIGAAQWKVTDNGAHPDGPLTPPWSSVTQTSYQAGKIQLDYAAAVAPSAYLQGAPQLGVFAAVTLDSIICTAAGAGRIATQLALFDGLGGTPGNYFVLQAGMNSDGTLDSFSVVYVDHTGAVDALTFSGITDPLPVQLKIGYYLDHTGAAHLHAEIGSSFTEWDTRGHTLRAGGEPGAFIALSPGNDATLNGCQATLSTVRTNSWNGNLHGVP